MVGEQITVEQLTELSIVMRISRYDTVTGKGQRKIEPKSKHFSYCKKDQSSRPNQTDNSKRLAKITNHT